MDHRQTAISLLTEAAAATDPDMMNGDAYPLAMALDGIGHALLDVAAAIRERTAAIAS